MTGAERRNRVQRLFAASGRQDRRTKRSKRTLLDVVVGKGSAVLELLSCKDESLLVGRDALLVLDLGLDIVNRVRGLDLKGDGLAGEAGVESDAKSERESRQDRVRVGMGRVVSFRNHDGGMAGEPQSRAASPDGGRGGRTQANTLTS